MLGLLGVMVEWAISRVPSVELEVSYAVIGYGELAFAAPLGCCEGKGASRKPYPRVQSCDPLRDRAMMRFADSDEQKSRNEVVRAIAAESPATWQIQRYLIP